MNVYDQRETCKKIFMLAYDLQMTDKELAQKIHISQQAVSRWKKDSSPSIDNLCIMTSIFNVSLNEIVAIKTI